MRVGKNDMSKFLRSVFLLLAHIVLSLPLFAQTVTADFSYNQNCEAFDFFDNSVPVGGTVVQWDWDFGDGIGTSTDQNPSYTYAETGDFVVTLTVTLDDLSTTDQTSQTISIDPVAAFGFIQTCETVEFLDQSTASSGNITGWNWDFGDGIGTSTAQSPIYNYTAEGDFTVLLTVIHESGCEDTISKVISYYNPTSAFTYNNGCEMFLFQNQSTVTSGDMTYLWNFGDGIGTSTLQNPTYTYTSPGDYTVSLIVTHESGCTDHNDQLISFQKPIAQFSHDVVCLGLETCFYDESIPNADSLIAWIWDFGDGSSSSLQNPCYTYNAVGDYEVSLTVINSSNCASEPTIETISVDYPPEADFYAIPVCFHDSSQFINLTDTHDIEIAYWEWDFDDPSSGVNNTSNLFEPKHLFSQEGVYNVKLFVENINGCQSEVYKPVVVDSLPEANFTMQDTVAVGIEFTITDLSVPHGYPILTWYWDFGDGNTAINPNPITHTYMEAGSYSICLVVSDFNGCTDTTCQTIVVTALPYVDFSYSADLSLLTNFYDESTPDTTLINWFWDFGDLMVTTDTISGTPNPTYQYPAEGFYSVYLKVWDSYGGMRDTTKIIYIGNALVAGFYFEDICFGDSIYFHDESYSPLSADIESWYWNFGDGTDSLYIQQDDIIAHYYTQPGTYNVYLVITGLLNGYPITDTIYQEVNIHALPVAIIDSSNLIVCLGTSVHFIDESYTINGDSIVSWFWDFGDGTTSEEQNYDHEYDVLGDYTVILNITTNYGCAGTDTVIAKATTAPDITFEIENACVNSPTRFVPSESDVEVTEWFWNFDDHNDPLNNTDTIESPTHTYTSVNTYTVTMYASSFDCYLELEQSFLVYPIPYSDFSYVQDYEGVQGRIQFINQSVYANSYLWDFGNGQTSSVSDPIEVYEHDSTYTVTLISKNEYTCADTSRYDILVFFRGLYFPTAFSPNNPNEEISKFTPKGVNLSNYHAQVFDTRGNIMWESDLLDENGSPVESWDGYYNGFLMPQGVYVWKASGTFKDGTVWKGSTFQSENPQTHGTVTLIR